MSADKGGVNSGPSFEALVREQSGPTLARLGFEFRESFTQAGRDVVLFEAPTTSLLPRFARVMPDYGLDLPKCVDLWVYHSHGDGSIECHIEGFNIAEMLERAGKPSSLRAMTSDVSPREQLSAAMRDVERLFS